MIVPCLCDKRLSHDLSPPSEVLCVVDGKKSAQGTTRSLKPRRSLCGGESATDSSLGQNIRISPPPPYQKGEEECNSPKTIFNIVEWSESDKVI